MRGASRGMMFKFGCGSAYRTRGYSDLEREAGLSAPDNIEFRSYLYQLISQVAEPRQKDEPKISTAIEELLRSIRIGPDALDVVTVAVALMFLLGVGIGGCYLLGWMVDGQARQARLQVAEEYAASHPEIVQQFEPQMVQAQYGMASAGYSPAYGSPRTATTGIAGGAEGYMYWR
jgi:hypothetical protein